jgi:hypothetical protein
MGATNLLPVETVAPAHSAAAPPKTTTTNAIADNYIPPNGATSQSGKLANSNANTNPRTNANTKAHNRRHSLPLHFLPQNLNLWNSPSSRPSAAKSEEAALGEHTSVLSESNIATHISALRQLHGTSGGDSVSAAEDWTRRHRYAKSAGARNSTYSQPVIVRTYSGSRPASRNTETRVGSIRGRDSLGKGDIKEVDKMGKAELPPVEAFTFKNIMEHIQGNVADDLERIAEICARSRYSLSNQYEVHMPPHGQGENFITAAPVGNGHQVGGPTLQAIASDDEAPRPQRRGRRPKSRAYGTLETIMSSSRSSEEEMSKKKNAEVLAEEVRGRAARKSGIPSRKAEASKNHHASDADNEASGHKLSRSRAATLASVVTNNGHGQAPHITLHSLISNLAQPQTTTPRPLVPLEDEDLYSVPSIIHPATPTAPIIADIEPQLSPIIIEPDTKPTSVLSNITSWLSSLPWTKHAETGDEVLASNAEGSLKRLLKMAEEDRKGKNVDRVLAGD